MKKAKTVIGKADELIEWYEKNKPDAGKRIEISVTPAELKKAFGLKVEKGEKVEQREWPYRNRTLVAIK